MLVLYSVPLPALTFHTRDWRLAMFKLPSYDPVSIAVMGFGILLRAALALTL